MNIKKIVGQKIQEYRKNNKITQEQLAEMIGIETVSLSKIETGRSYPTSENLAKISKILNAEPYEFFLANKTPKNEDLLKEINQNIIEISNDNKKLMLLNVMVKSLLQ